MTDQSKKQTTFPIAEYMGDLKAAVARLSKRDAESLLDESCRRDWLLKNGFIDGIHGVARNSLPVVRARLGDFIATPPEVLDALLDSSMPPPRGPVLDPCAGNGAILRRLAERGWRREDLFAIEIREEEREELESVSHHAHLEDWTTLRRNLRYKCPECGGFITPPDSFDPRHDLPRVCDCCLTSADGRMYVSRGWRGWPASTVITNPPYSQIPAFPLACLSPGLPGRLRYLALLMPVEELAGVRRCTWFAQHPPTGMVHLSWRPFPNVRGVAWYVWERGREPLWMEWE